MKAQVLFFFAAAAVIALAACNKNTPEQDINKQYQEQSAIVSVIAHLTGQKVDSFEGKTFEPRMTHAKNNTLSFTEYTLSV